MPGSTASEDSNILTPSVTSSTRPKNHVCDFENCTKAYSRPALLEQHKRSHTGERPFVCTYPDCDKSFLRKSHLVAHQLSHQSQEDKPFHCSICGKGVNTIQHLKRHEITHTKSFKCDYEGCTESFYKHQSLRHHVSLVHEKTLSCKICNKTFSRPNKLANHNIKLHSETPTYQCDFKGCFKNFKTWSALQLHIKTDHPKLKCPICERGCVGKQGLQSHMVSHNTNEATKLWNCDYCDLGRFVKKVDLIKHYELLHDGNVPESLLKPDDQSKLQFYGDGTTVENLREIEQENFAANSQTPSINSIASIASLNSALTKNSIIELFSRNYNTKTIVCPKQKCDRTFSRDHDLRRHLAWHEEHSRKITSYLSSLRDEQVTGDSEPTEDDLNREDDMNSMIDDELKKLQNNTLAN